MSPTRTHAAFYVLFKDKTWKLEWIEFLDECISLEDTIHQGRQLLRTQLDKNKVEYVVIGPCYSCESI